MDLESVVARYGPWYAFNIALGDGAYTMAPGRFGAAELRVRQTLQVVADLAHKRLDELSALDLGCHEGGFAIELALHGAKVLAVDGREGHLAKLRFAADALGLDDVKTRQADVRDLSVETVGTFDVVLALGILYHLPAAALPAFITRLHGLSEDMVVIETNVALRPQVSVDVDGHRLHGIVVGEERSTEGSAMDRQPSFWPTKGCLLNLLSDAGFSSVVEVATPSVPDLVRYRDHVVLAAFCGERRAVRTLPELADIADAPWPDDGRTVRQPQQGRWSRIADRIAERRGRGIARQVRSKRHL